MLRVYYKQMDPTEFHALQHSPMDTPATKPHPPLVRSIEHIVDGDAVTEAAEVRSVLPPFNICLLSTENSPTCPSQHQVTRSLLTLPKLKVGATYVHLEQSLPLMDLGIQQFRETARYVAYLRYEGKLPHPPNPTSQRLAVRRSLLALPK